MSINPNSTRLAVTFLAILGVALSSLADEPPGNHGGESAFVFQDGMFVRGKLDVKAFEVETEYGKLVIPFASVVRIRIGRRIDNELVAHIEKLVADLRKEDFTVRETAQRELGKLGKLAYWKIEAATRSQDAEQAARANALLADMDLDEEEIIQPLEDEVVTTSFTVRGILRLDTFSVTTRFGSIKIDKNDLLLVEIKEPDLAHKTVRLSARYGTQGQWYNTGLNVRKNDRLVVEATGSISWPNNNSTTEPKGNPSLGTWDGDRGPTAVNVGSLVGKIGSHGTLFYIGEKYNDKAASSGRLYLWIATGWGPDQTAGEYEAKIEVRPAPAAASVASSP